MLIYTMSQIEIVRSGQGSYRLRMNGSLIEANVQTLCDGGLLMQVFILAHKYNLRLKSTAERVLILWL
jgi:acetyl-CoA carboxylase/biotin carboxylase 1